MAVGIIIHMSVGAEKRTEIFAQEHISIGATEDCDLQIRSKQVEEDSVWIRLENTDGVFRIIDFDSRLPLKFNDGDIRRFVALNDADTISLDGTDISFIFFGIKSRASMITTNRETHVANFIEEAAIEAAATPERDDAKAFLREFSRELMREISWTTKAVILVLVLGFISGILYLGYAVNNELRTSRELAQRQNDVIESLEKKLGQTSDQIGALEKTNTDLVKNISLAQNVRVEYGNGVCLIYGIYDLVDRKTGKVLRYPDPNSYAPNPYEPQTEPNEGDEPLVAEPQTGLTTEGNGSTVEYDFVGTGFHVGEGFIVTNKHVLQPWTEDDVVKQMMRNAKGRARLKRLVVYFPGVTTPFTMKVAATGGREDVAVGKVDAESLPESIVALPLETDGSSQTIGKTVVTMGYPSGPDRLLAMVDENEMKSLSSRFGNSRQNLINYLAESNRIVPLLTQGAITDLDSRRIVHDARSTEGSSGAPIFGQSGKVIGVHFGVFTESSAVNMAVPIRFGLELLSKAGWYAPGEAPPQNQNTAEAANTRTEQSAAK